MWGMMERGKKSQKKKQQQYKLSREILDIKHFFFYTKYQRSLVSHIKYTDIFLNKSISVWVSTQA